MQSHSIRMFFVIMLFFMKIACLYAHSETLKMCVRDNTFSCINYRCAHVQEAMQCKKMCYQVAVKKCLGTHHQHRYNYDRSRIIHAYMS